MEKRKVEFELDVNKLASWGAVIATVLGALWWIVSAQTTHETVAAMPPPAQLESTEQLVKDLAKGRKEVNEGIRQLQLEEKLRKELWGESYRKKISSIVDEYDNKDD